MSTDTTGESTEISAADDAAIVRMAVISDIHAVSFEARRSVSWARTWLTGDPRMNALDAVKALLANDPTISADVLLCPGDLADSRSGVDTDGMQYAWEELQDIATCLGSATLVATAGNHDVERPPAPPAALPPDYSPSVHLKALAPPFPTTTRDDKTIYFAEDFVVVRDEQWRVVSLNSCAEHDMDHRRGSIRQSTIDNISAVLEDDADPPPINIFMCHHHPVEWTHLAPADTSHMRLGEQLLRTLDVADPSRWLFLHGHRHQPTIGYAGESTSGPVRFSAGSLSCTPYQEQGAVRNQFYLLEFDIERLRALGLPGGGRLLPRDWRFRTGMRPAAADSGIPQSGGFGWRRDAFELAARCHQMVNDRGNRVLSWDDLVEDDPRWYFLAPADVAAFTRCLKPLGGHAEIDCGKIVEVSFNV